MILFRRLALVATTLTIIQIGSGALVRATGSGDGCPDWPRCFGRWFPPLEYHAIIEWSHRFIGQFAIWAVIALAVAATIRLRRERRFFGGALIAVAGILLQAILGAIVVASKGPDAKIAEMGAWFVTFHIATAMLLIGLLVFLTVSAFLREDSTSVSPQVERWARRSMIAVFALLLIGAYTRGEGAALAFRDWPLMDGGLMPQAFDHLKGTHFLHRLAALVVGVALAVFAVSATRAQPRNKAVMTFAHLAATLYVAQVIVGGLQVLTRLNAAPVVAHVILSALIWSATVAAFTIARLDSARATARAVDGAMPGRAPASSRIKAYIALTKPRIIMLLLVTTVPTMVLAARGWPGTWLVSVTVIGGTLAAGAANAINCFIDRDIDAVMKRTRSRPLPAHDVAPLPSLVFALSLAVTSFVLMTWQVNLLAALLTQSAVLFYVFVYTLGLKRSTPQNIVIGGAAGAVPVLVGWAAVTGTVGWPAVLLFMVIFLWTPPHFWALAVRYAKDYADAGVPMMPVVAGPASTYRQILGYTFATVAVTLALFPVGSLGVVYLVSAAALGVWFIRHAVVLLREGTPRAAMDLFHFSISYLALLFAAVGIDAATMRAS